MWNNTAKWFQDRAQEAIQKAEEVRASRVVADLETHGKTFLQALVAPGFANDAFGEPRGGQEKGVVLHYITERIIGMAFPDPVDKVSALLAEKHAGHFMIWNISEDAYDYSKFENQVLEFKFPGHPAPPLGLLVKMCTSIENWLQADPKNVAVIHCLTGKGRTSTVIAALLCWLGWDVGQGTEAFQNITTMQALQYVADRMGLDLHKVTIPSQRRYLQYFGNMVDGVKPRSEPLLLRRVIMNSIPRFGRPPKRRVEGATTEGGHKAEEEEEEKEVELGCCPYLQLFKGGKLIFTSPCSRNGSVGTGKGEGGVTMLPWAFQSDGSIIFATDCVLQGDILVRTRHLAPSGQKVSMFRAAFHTGYVPCGVLRLSKSHLDGACNDTRFDDDFFIDLIFAPVEEAGTEGGATPTAGGGGAGTNLANQRRDLGVIANTEDKDNYDAMLHKDTRFWKEIAARKRRAAQRARVARLEKESGGGGKAAKFSIGGDDESDGSLIVFDNTPTMLPESPLAPAGPFPSSTTKSLSAPSSSVMDLLSDDALLQELHEAEGSSFEPPPSTAPATTKVDSAEINALEELEKELGLEFLQATATTATTPGGSTSSGGGGGGGEGGDKAATSSAGGPSAEPAVDLSSLDLDENLDDFEEFLSSLDQKGSGGAGTS